MRKITVFIILSALCAGCMIGPNYRRPFLDVPASYREEQASEENSVNDAVSLGDLQWWKLFGDPQLQNLIRTALVHNYDVGIAASRLAQAQAQLDLALSYEFPSVNGNAMVNPERVAKTHLVPAYEETLKEVDLSFSWTLDIWGKYRRMIEEAHANVIASQWGKRAVIMTLISQVAQAYFQLRQMDDQLEISKRTLVDDQKTFQLTKGLVHYGASPLLDQYQAQQLVESASESITDLERRIAQQEDLISILIGSNPSDVVRGLPLTQEPSDLQVPVGLPSSLLERRPDIQEAEQQLIAANAQIGVAQADYFPEISLTGDGGFESSALRDLFSGPAGMWSFAANLTQPIFTAGRVGSEVKLAHAQEQEALLNYRKTIQEAFREVSDALVAVYKYHEYRLQQEILTHASGKSAHLSDALYREGAASYLEVLDNYTRYFQSELALSQARFNELQGLVQLYQSLGGGWQG